MRTTPSFSRLLLPLAISATLAACGGDGGSSGGGSGSTPSSVGGAASKGIIIGGIVNAYPINDDGSVNRDVTLADETTTAEDGSYSLTLNGNYTVGNAVYIEITAADGTLMRCDLASCGNDGEGNPVVFGETYPLANDFAMSAVLPSAGSGAVSVNVTPLTDVAAALTLKKVVAGARAADAAAAANAQIADRLGLSGELVQQPIVDITSAEAVNNADKDALTYNLKAAAVVAASKKDNPDLSLEEALETFTSQYADGNGLADKEDSESTSVTLEEILEESLALLEEVKKQEGVDEESEGLSQAETEVAAEEADAETNGSTEPSQGDVPDDVGSEGLQATKSFVQQVRDLANAGMITENQEAFADQVELAADAVSGDMEPVTEGLSQGLNAIAYAWEAYQDAVDNDETPPTSHEQEGVIVSISNSGGVTSYSVDQDVVVTVEEEDEFGQLQLREVTVSLNLSAQDGGSMEYSDELNADSTEEAWSGTESVSVSLSLAMSGSASTEQLALEIADSSSFSGSFESSEDYDETNTGSGYSGDWEGSARLTDLNASLQVVLRQLQPLEEGEPTVSFTGRLALGVDLATLAWDNDDAANWGGSGWSYSDNTEESVSIDGFDLTLSGEFANSDGESLAASLALAVDNFSETCNAAFSQGYDQEQGSYYSDEESCTEESAEDYAAANLTVIFSVDLDGVADDVKVEATASRTGLESGELSIDLSYGGNRLDLEYAGDDSVEVSNHNSVVMVLTETENDSGATLISGTISHGGTVYADVDEESGAILVRYSDGSFETVM